MPMIFVTDLILKCDIYNLAKTKALSILYLCLISIKWNEMNEAKRLMGLRSTSWWFQSS